MLHDFAIEMVWAPMLRAVGDALGQPVESIEVHVERRPLEKTIDVPGMGQFDAGTQGAFRFEVRAEGPRAIRTRGDLGRDACRSTCSEAASVASSALASGLEV